MDLTAKKVLLINFGGLSELVLTLPLLNILKRYSDISLSLLTLKCNEELLLSNPKVDNLILFDPEGMVDSRQGGKVKSLNSFKALIEETKKGSFDLVFDLEGSFKTSLLSFLSRSKIRVGAKNGLASLLYTHRLDNGSNLHRLDLYLSLLEEIGIDNDSPIEFPLPEWKRAKGYIENLYQKDKFFDSTPIIALYPSGREGCWSEDKYYEFNNWLEDNLDCGVLIFTNGQGIGRALIRSKRSNRINNLIAKFDLKEKVELLKRVDILITDDSLAISLANLSKTPTLALSNSKTQSLGPYEGDNLFLKGPDDDLSQIKVQTVIDFLENLL